MRLFLNTKKKKELASKSNSQTSGHTLDLRECFAETHWPVCTASHSAIVTSFPLDFPDSTGEKLPTGSGNTARSSTARCHWGVKRSWGTRLYSWKRNAATALTQAGILVLGLRSMRAWMIWKGEQSATKRDRDRVRERSWQEICFRRSSWLTATCRDFKHSRHR